MNGVSSSDEGGDMCVNMDDRESCAFDVCLVNVEHTPRLIFGYIERSALVRLGRGRLLRLCRMKTCRSTHPDSFEKISSVCFHLYSWPACRYRSVYRDIRLEELPRGCAG